MNNFFSKDDIVRRLPVNQETIEFQGWTISYEKSHILKSVCVSGKQCSPEDPNCCELCVYRNKLQLPHLPDMVFHKNKLTLAHKNGATLEFNPMDALSLVDNGKPSITVACAEEWQGSRAGYSLEEKFKPFDWTFTTTYQGTLNETFQVEATDTKLNMCKLMEREKILFYHDLTLYEDELHDNGISSCSVKIRVMPSGFYILLRHFLRVDRVLLRMNDTRYHFETGNNYILKEFTTRRENYDALTKVPPVILTSPEEVESYLPVVSKRTFKLSFE